jgi:hypothetical protein
MWDALRLDVRHSVRSLRRVPTFSLTVIATLTLAVGATAAVGSLLNAVVLRKLAVPSPEQLVAVSALEPGANVGGYFYADTFNAFRATQQSFAQLSMYAGGGIMRVETRAGVFEDAVTEAVSPSYFDIVGARPSAGRFFSDSDEAGVVISEAYRRRLFGNATGIGEAIRFNGTPATVIGIAADGFDGLRFDGTVDIIVPLALMRSAAGNPSRPIRSPQVVGRLAPGVSIDAARAELLARWPSVQSATLPATVPDAEREALLRQRLTGAAQPVRHHALGADGPDGDSPGGRVRQPGGTDPDAIADPTPPGGYPPGTGRKPAARVLADAGRCAPVVGGGVRRGGAAGVGDHSGRDGIPPVRTHELQVSDADA